GRSLPGPRVAVGPVDGGHDAAAGGQMLSVEVDIRHGPAGKHRDEGGGATDLLREGDGQEPSLECTALGGLVCDPVPPVGAGVELLRCERDETGDRDHRPQHVLQFDSGTAGVKQYALLVTVPR